MWTQIGTYSIPTTHSGNTRTDPNTHAQKHTAIETDIHRETYTHFTAPQRHRHTFRHPQRGRKETQEHKDAFTCAHELSRATDSRPFPCSALEILTGLGVGGSSSSPPRGEGEPAPRSPWTPAQDSQNQTESTHPPTLLEVPLPVGWGSCPRPGAKAGDSSETSLSGDPGWVWEALAPSLGLGWRGWRSVSEMGLLLGVCCLDWYRSPHVTFHCH